MSNDELKRLLLQVHEGLRNTEQVDVELKPLLQQLNSDIETALLKDVRSDDPLLASLNQRSMDISARFAAQHPKLEPLLRELGSILEKIGV